MPKLSPLLSIKQEQHEKLGKVAVISVGTVSGRHPFDTVTWDSDGHLVDVSFRVGPKTAAKLIKELQKLTKKGAK